jgi:cell division protein FtsQ
MDLDTARKIAKLALRLGGVVLVVGAVFAIGLIGWQWQANVSVKAVAVEGAEQVHPDTLRALARVDSGTVMDQIDPNLVTDRVQRHPWVQHVNVERRRATRTLGLVVTERTPAALVIQDGRPAFYLDAAGFAMPLPDSAGFDVPLVHGLDAPYNPIKTVASSELSGFLQALDGHAAQALITEVDIDGGQTIRVLTIPTAKHPGVVADLGRSTFGQRLKRLVAFHHQVLQDDPDPPVGYVDLRFDGQIVTRPEPVDG